MCISFQLWRPNRDLTAPDMPPKKNPDENLEDYNNSLLQILDRFAQKCLSQEEIIKAASAAAAASVSEAIVKYLEKEKVNKGQEQSSNVVINAGHQSSGNLTNCKVRFTGLGDNVEVFLAAINAYIEANSVSEKRALLALPCLLLEDAGVWFETVKSTITKWDEFQKQIRFAYSEQLTNELVLLKWCALQNHESTSTELFVARCRSLLSHM